MQGSIWVSMIPKSSYLDSANGQVLNLNDLYFMVEARGLEPLRILGRKRPTGFYLECYAPASTTISRDAPKAQPLRFGGPVLPVLPRAPLPRFHVPWAGVLQNCPLHSNGGQCSTPDWRRNWPTHREPCLSPFGRTGVGALFAVSIGG